MKELPFFSPDILCVFENTFDGYYPLWISFSANAKGIMGPSFEKVSFSFENHVENSVFFHFYIVILRFSTAVQFERILDVA